MNTDANIISEIKETFNSIKTIITSGLQVFPTEITVILIPAVLVVCGIFIYRFIR